MEEKYYIQAEIKRFKDINGRYPSHTEELNIIKQVRYGLSCNEYQKQEKQKEDYLKAKDGV